jgi:hypothetical protein
MVTASDALSMVALVAACTIPYSLSTLPLHHTTGLLLVGLVAAALLFVNVLDFEAELALSRPATRLNLRRGAHSRRTGRQPDSRAGGGRVGGSTGVVLGCRRGDCAHRLSSRVERGSGCRLARATPAWRRS